MKNLGATFIIDHVDHGSTILHGSINRKLLEIGNNTDIIIVNENNLDAIKTQPQQPPIPLPQLAIPIIEYNHAIPIKRKHKPNAGMNIGSYKFKSKSSKK